MLGGRWPRTFMVLLSFKLCGIFSSATIDVAKRSIYVGSESYWYKTLVKVCN